MVANQEVLVRSTPYGPDGFDHLGKPQASETYSFPGYRIHLFKGEEFRKNKFALMQAAVRLDKAIFKISYWEALTEVVHNMGMDSVSAMFVEPLKPQTPLLQVQHERGRERVVDGFIRKLTSSFTEVNDRQEIPSNQQSLELSFADPFVGYITYEGWRVRTDSRIMTAEYISTIAFLPEHRQHGLGRFLIQMVCGKHEPETLALRSQIGAVVPMVENAIETVGGAYGVDKEWNTNPFMMSFKRPFFEKTLHPHEFDDERFIATGVYPDGRNRAYTPDPSNLRAMEVDRILSERINIDRGDGAYIAWFTAFARGRQKFFMVHRLPAVA